MLHEGIGLKICDNGDEHRLDGVGSHENKIRMDGEIVLRGDGDDYLLWCVLVVPGGVLCGILLLVNFGGVDGGAWLWVGAVVVAVIDG
jgi:hypothetical protein